MENQNPIGAVSSGGILYVRAGAGQRSMQSCSKYLGECREEAQLQHLVGSLKSLNRVRHSRFLLPPLLRASLERGFLQIRSLKDTLETEWRPFGSQFRCGDACDGHSALS